MAGSAEVGRGAVVGPTTKTRKRSHHRVKFEDDPMVPIRGHRVRAVLEILGISQAGAEKTFASRDPPVQITQQGINQLVRRRIGKCRRSVRGGFAAELGVPEEWLAGEAERLPGNDPTTWEKFLVLRSAAPIALKALQTPRKPERATWALETLCVYLDKDDLLDRWKSQPLPDDVKRKSDSMTALRREVYARRLKSATYKRSLRELEDLVAILGDRGEVARLFGKALGPDAVAVHDFARWNLMGTCQWAWNRQTGGLPLDAEGFRVLGLVDSLLGSQWVGPLDVERPKEISASGAGVLNRFRFLTGLLSRWLDGQATLDASRLLLLHEALVAPTRREARTPDGLHRRAKSGPDSTRYRRNLRSG